ncbi:uncharacterized protein LOC111393430 [Olea europaea var. sylvestris]|uniref:uncharacterized protein LOC111393430 n=1 Tax=Olea europaea var. sylvestris TaxID=158386 RepID=UPI000C1CFC9D|nr:uncharacterized protein LOC111393430 [Olea europaea var. sylvestris]
MIMGWQSFVVRVQKLRSWKKCSRYIQEQRTRLYIIWRCLVFLLRSKLESASFDD